MPVPISGRIAGTACAFKASGLNGRCCLAIRLGPGYVFESDLLTLQGGDVFVGDDHHITRQSKSRRGHIEEHSYRPLALFGTRETNEMHGASSRKREAREPGLV